MKIKEVKPKKCCKEYLHYCYQKLGSATSERKANASRENGKKGGRPKNKKSVQPKGSKRKGDL